MGDSVSAFRPTEAELRAVEEKHEVELDTARTRWRHVLIEAGVPFEEASDILAGLERQGFSPRVRTGVGRLSGGALFASYYDPNVIRCEGLDLVQKWQPLEEPPDPPWIPCKPGWDFGDLPTCENTGHGEHYRSIVYGPMHQALPEEMNRG